jgi:lysophospholipase L1-like esterase
VLFNAKQKIVFIGDSITDADHMSGDNVPYGNGYVNIVRNMLLARYPERDVVVVNKGIGGNTIRDLDQRWERDVIAEKPDWLAVFIGINDVWNHFRNNAQGAVPLDEYQATLRRLLKRAQDATGAKLILAEPYMIEPNRNDLMRQLMDVYGQTVCGIAAEFNAVLVRTQEAFDQSLMVTSGGFWSADRIHPNGPGNAVLALAFLRALEFAL